MDREHATARTSPAAGPAGADRRPRGRLVGRLAVAGAAAAVLVGVAGPAAAHVLISPSTTAAGAEAVVVLTVEHGCEGSPTTAVAIRIPDEILSATPVAGTQWDVDAETEPLAEPVLGADGTQVGERVTTVTYRAVRPLPDGHPVTMELAVRLPDEEGAALAFPTVQTCEQGELAWLELAEDGRSDEGLELPAPVLVVTAADGGGAGTGAVAAEESGFSGIDALTVGVLGTGVLGTALVGGVVARQRRRA